MTSQDATGPSWRPTRRAPDRRELIGLAVVFVAAVAWGAVWKRSAALVEVASFLPSLLLLIGPGALVLFVGYRLFTGRILTRVVGFATGAALAGALVGNLLAPGIPPSADVGGHVTGTLDGVAVDGPATCTWGPGRTAVIRVRSPLPQTAGQQDGAFSPGLPAGTLNLELPSGALTVTDITAGSGPAVLPLRNGSGDIAAGDRATGTLTLDPAQRDLVAGQLRWTCEAAPAS